MYCKGSDLAALLTQYLEMPLLRMAINSLTGMFLYIPATPESGIHRLVALHHRSFVQRHYEVAEMHWKHNINLDGIALLELQREKAITILDTQHPDQALQGPSGSQILKALEKECGQSGSTLCGHDQVGLYARTLARLQTTRPESMIDPVLTQFL